MFQIQQAMYNFKEKKLHFNALRNPDAAVYDLELLLAIRKDMQVISSILSWI